MEGHHHTSMPTTTPPGGENTSSTSHHAWAEELPRPPSGGVALQPSGGRARTDGGVEEVLSDSDEAERAADCYAEDAMIAKFYGADAHSLYD